MSDPHLDRQDDDALAAEYVLRLLQGDELRQAELRAQTEPEFAARVARWQEEFSEIAEEVTPVAPRRAVKRRLQARLFEGAGGGAAGAWRWLALGSMALSLALLLLVFLPVPMSSPPRGTPEAQMPLYLSEVASEDGALRMLAVYDPADRSLRLRRIAGVAPEGRVLELWAIAEGAAPISVGLVEGAEGQRLPLPSGLDPLAAGAPLLLAVSDEPPGGSPTGLPTGNVLAAGPLTRL
jgi:anti-sigma-K factor RskA